MSDGLIVIGGGEYARVVIEAAQAQGFDVLGFVDPQPCEETCQRLKVRHLGTDDNLPESPLLVLAVGSVKVEDTRSKIVQKIEARRAVRWTTVVHPRAWVSPTAIVEPSAVILAGAVVCSGARIGAHAIVNICASIDHDVVVGKFVHVAPHAALGGGAQIGDHAYIGMSAVIRDHRKVAERTLVGMAAVVTKEFPAGAVLIGSPARTL